MLFERNKQSVNLYYIYGVCIYGDRFLSFNAGLSFSVVMMIALHSRKEIPVLSPVPLHNHQPHSRTR